MESISSMARRNSMSHFMSKPDFPSHNSVFIVVATPTLWTKPPPHPPRSSLFSPPAQANPGFPLDGSIDIKFYPSHLKWYPTNIFPNLIFEHMWMHTSSYDTIQAPCSMIIVHAPSIHRSCEHSAGHGSRTRDHGTCPKPPFRQFKGGLEPDGSGLKQRFCSVSNRLVWFPMKLNKI